MRKLIYGASVSLDGFIARPDGRLDWTLVDEELHRFFNQQAREVGASLYGRRMYELMNAFWPNADADPANPDYIVEFARIWKATPKIVFSRTLERVDGNARLVREANTSEIIKLKEQPGKDLEISGADLAGNLMRLGLIDAYQLSITPVILGRGIRLFPELAEQTDMELVETRTFRSGVVYLHYRKVGKRG